MEKFALIVALFIEVYVYIHFGSTSEPVRSWVWPAVYLYLSTQLILPKSVWNGFTRRKELIWCDTWKYCL